MAWYGGRVTALWVAPDPPVAFEQTLSDHDIDLRYGSTVAAVLSVAHDEEIDVVVVPGTLDEDLSAVERLSTALDVPVIYVAERDQSEDVENALDRGATATVAGVPAAIANRLQREAQTAADRRDARLFEQFLSGLHLDTGDTVYFKDKESRFIRISESKAREVDESRSDVRGKSDFDYMPALEARDRYQEEQRIMETGELIVGKEERLATPDGVTWYRVTKLPRYDENGEIVGTFGLSRDISELKALEETLSELEAVVDRVPVWLLAVDADGRVTWANEPARRNLVGTDERLLDRPLIDDPAQGAPLLDSFAEQFDTAITTLMADWGDRRAETDHPPTDVSDDRTESDGERTSTSDDGGDEQVGNFHDRYVSQEVQIDPIDGDPRICNIHVRLLPLADGAYNGAVLAFHDVTTQVENERELRRQNERLERLVRTISHDLRNPLQVASGYVESAAAEFESELVTGAADALTRMDELVDDLLSMAHEGRELTDPEPVSLDAVARQAWQAFEDEPAILTVAGTTTIEGDSDRLVRLFENCFRNSIEHGTAGAESESGAEDDSVTITVGPIDGGGFYVADDGSGIPADERETIFEDGYTTSEDGTGFGLAIVEEIARAHGLEATATESRDGGARLEFTPPGDRMESQGDDAFGQWT